MGGMDGMGDYVTRAELAGRLEPLAEIRGMLREDMTRLHLGQDNLSEQIREMDARITSRQDVANGRTTHVEEEVNAAHKAIDEVRARGCAHLQPHKETLHELKKISRENGWRPTKRQVGIGAGLTVFGAIAVKLIELIQAWITHAGVGLK